MAEGELSAAFGEEVAENVSVGPMPSEPTVKERSESSSPLTSAPSTVTSTPSYAMEPPQTSNRSTRSSVRKRAHDAVGGQYAIPHASASQPLPHAQSTPRVVREMAIPSCM
ncbi:hypothetical protein C8Q77DRAFT_770181 [Trametes polyzona]|nr:hypothetical protein C8Q77DRAFT_770181 [Trametes polyzona]